MMKIRKNVLVIAPAGIVGGIENLFLNALPLLRQKGYNFIFCVNEKGPAINEYQKLGFEGVVVEDKDPKVIKKIENIIREYKINLVHSNRISQEVSALAANNCRISHLLHLHSKIGYSYFSTRKPEYIKKRVRSICRLSDFAIDCSQFVTKELNGFIDSSKLVCIYDGVPIKKLFSPKPTTNNRIKTVGMVAHFYSLKRHRDFILAAAHVLKRGYDVNFFIAGHCWVNSKSQETYFKNLKKWIKYLGLVDNIKLYKGLKDITHLYREMDIFVLPSIGEGFSIALLEAMQFARPVIVTKSGGFPEVIKHRENGFLVGEERPKEIAQTIIKLLEDKNLAQKVGQNARRTVEKRFDINRFVNELSTVYDSLI